MLFFKLLKKSGPVEGTPEAEEAPQYLKRYLASPPVLVAPAEKEPLLLYITATNQVVSAVLVAERDDDPDDARCDGDDDGDDFPLREGIPLMTHKYRGSIVVLSISKSVEPNEEQKVLTSRFQQGFTASTKREIFLEF